MMDATRRAEPTGTVDLLTTTVSAPSGIMLAISVAAAST